MLRERSNTLSAGPFIKVVRWIVGMEPIFIAPYVQKSCKREFHHFRLDQFITYSYKELCVKARMRPVYIPHTDRFLRRGRLGSGSHITDLVTGGIFNLIMMTGNALFDHFKTHEFSVHTGGFLHRQHIFRGKIFGEFGDPSQAGFERTGGIINIISIETIAHFQAEGIAGTETDRLDAFACTSYENGVPNFIGVIVLVFEIDLYSTCSGITGGTHQYILHTGEYAFGKSVIFQIQDIHIRE